MAASVWVFISSFSLLLVVSRPTNNGHGHGGECPRPPNFPETLVELKNTSYENWSEELYIPDIWEAYPETTEDVVILANWAYENKFNLRPRGGKYSWAPLTYPVPALNPIGKGNPYPCYTIPKVILVATDKYLTRLQLNGSTPKDSSVIVQTGVTMNALTGFLASSGLGLSLASITSNGNISVGGLLATGSHGIGLSQNRLTNYEKIPGKFGSLSDLVLRLEAVIWNPTSGKYEIQNFERSDPRIAPLLACLGRIFVTQVTLRVGRDERVRCLTISNIPVEEVFAKPNSVNGVEVPKNSFASFVQESGMIGLLYYPFASEPLIRIWSQSPEKPSSSRETNEPYNYYFQENIPAIFSHLVGYLSSGNSAFTVTSNQAIANFLKVKLKLTQTEDLWGWSRNTMFYVKPNTVRVSVTGFAILTTYTSIQRTISQIYEIYNGLLEDYRSKGKYPLNGPIEIRLTSVANYVDLDEDNLMPLGSVTPSFTANSPYPPRPEYDVCVWVDITTLSKTKYVEEIMFDLQSKFFELFNGEEGEAFVRPDWSKRWGYSDYDVLGNYNDGLVRGAWTNEAFFEHIPRRYSDWKGASQILSDLDPNHVFFNPFFDSILP